MTEKWDKTFELDADVNHKKVTFKNRFGITIAADLYEPKGNFNRLLGIAVSGPFGAVKEQASGLYAMQMAKRGFLAIAFDPSFTGESSGYPRNVASPDINTEDFQAAVDYLMTLDRVDHSRISIIGICGWGGIALNTASIDTRIKVTIASTMYDMSRVNHSGYFDKLTEEELYQQKIALNAQRLLDFQSGIYKRAGGVVDHLPENAPFYVKDYYDYYKTKRGYHIRSLNSNDGWNITSALSFINTPQLAHLAEIKNAVLLIHGDKAHSCYFSKDAYQHLKGENKRLLLIPNAVHTDLYDRLDAIPFEEMKKFIMKNTK